MFFSLSEFSMAKSYVDAIETSAGPTLTNSCLAHSVYYAKFTIYLHDRDRTATEDALWSLLKLPLTPFPTALQAVRRLDSEENTLDIDAVPYYKHLVAKYPKYVSLPRISYSVTADLLLTFAVSPSTLKCASATFCRF